MQDLLCGLEFAESSATTRLWTCRIRCSRFIWWSLWSCVMPDCQTALISIVSKPKSCITHPNRQSPWLPDFFFLFYFFFVCRTTVFWADQECLDVLFIYFSLGWKNSSWRPLLPLFGVILKWSDRRELPGCRFWPPKKVKANVHESLWEDEVEGWQSQRKGGKYCVRVRCLTCGWALWPGTSWNGLGSLQTVRGGMERKTAKMACGKSHAASPSFL